MNALRTATLLLALALVLGAASPAIAQGSPQAGQHVERSGTLNEDQYLAGQSVDVTANVTGDVVAAGGHVELSGEATGNVIVAGGNVRVGRRVGQDVMAAGGTVTVSGRVDDDVRAAGGTVSVAAAVGGDVVAAGGDVTLESGASVGGRAWLAGGNVDVRGNVGGELRVRGGAVRIDGTVRGDVDAQAKALTIGPNARIEGSLSYASPDEARIDPAARITGSVERRTLSAPMAARGVSWGAIAGFGVLMLLAVFTTVTVLRYVFPGFSLQSAETLVRHPWKSLALGFALILCIPAAAVLLMATVLGLPLGFSVLLLYPLALGLGRFVVVVWLAELIGRWLWGRRTGPIAWRVGVLWLSALLVFAVWLIPILGWLVTFALQLFGLGALGLHMADRYRGGGAAHPLR